MTMYADVVEPVENMLVVSHTDGSRELRLEQLLEAILQSSPYQEDLGTQPFEDLGSWAV